MANEYLSETEIKETKELRGTNYADLDLRLGLEAASRAIDEICGRRFWLDADANQVRTYTPRVSTIVEIDDLVTLTTLKIDRNHDGGFAETWTVGSDFRLEPENAAADGKPYEYLSVHPYGNFRYGFPDCAPSSVQVTGRFGWPSVPPQVKEATSLLTSRLVMRTREAPLGIVTIGVDAAIRLARTDPDVTGLLHGLPRGSLVFA